MKYFQIALCVCWLLAAVGQAAAQGGGRPPAKVAVAPITAGELRPTATFKGTVYFKEISDVATEVSGKVVEVSFEEGDRLTKGDPMVRLDDELLRAELEAARALVKQTQAELEQEKVRLGRAKLLLEDEVTTPQEYDDIIFTVEALGHRVSENQATVRQLETELAKKTTRAPYDGVVVDRQTELGEWEPSGAVVGTVARSDLFDVIANVPEEHLPWIEPGLEVTMTIAGRVVNGEVVTVIPKGDVSTRTFPVKIRLSGLDWLLEGMSADVAMPTGKEEQCLMVPREAVVLDRGAYALFTVEDGKATRVAVEVLGYAGLDAGVRSASLQTGDTVVTKGQERLQDGQTVQIITP